MKLPKYILRVGFQEWAIPDSAGVATIMKVLEHAMPVTAALHEKKIELLYTKSSRTNLLTHSTSVEVVRIPPGTVFTREAEDGTVEILRPRAINDAPKEKPPKRQALRGREPLQLEFGQG